MLDHAAMVTVSMGRYGVFDCKPLAFIWAKFPEHYNRANTIMFDDLRWVMTVRFPVTLVLSLACLPIS